MSTFDFEDSPGDTYGEAPPAYDYGQPELEGSEYENFGDSYAPPPTTNGMLDDSFVDDGPKLPPPTEMEPDESILLREWRQKRAAELEEKARLAREAHDEIVEQAKQAQVEFNKKRDATMGQAKINNREKEKAFLANLENLNAKAGSNYWEAVTGFINFDAPTGKKEKKTKGTEPQRTSTLLNDAKPGKHTDKARMRQILLKLKHSPPARAAA